MRFNHVISNSFIINGEPFLYSLVDCEYIDKKTRFVFKAKKNGRAVRVPRETLNKNSECHSISFCQFIEDVEQVNPYSDIWVLHYDNRRNKPQICYAQFISFTGEIALVRLYGDEAHQIKMHRKYLIAYTHDYVNNRCLRCEKKKPDMFEHLREAQEALHDHSLLK